MGRAHRYYRGAVQFLKARRTWLAWWDGKIRSLLFDLLVAVVAVRTGVDPDTLTAPGTYLLVACAGAFVVRRRFPWLPVAACGALAVVVAPATAACVAIYTMARRRGPSTELWIAGVVTTIFTLAGVYLRVDQLPVGYAVVPVVVLGMAMLLGLWVFQRKMLLVTLRERAEQAERERDLLAERAVATERRRIAREMHDVVAHRCSVISLQAGALTLTAQNARTEEIAEVIRSTSATALTELRGMLRVLRDDETETVSQPTGELANNPTVGSIRELVDEAIGARANIRLDLPDPVPETSSEVGRAAYRVVQEALTNAAKHAPHAQVRVEVAEQGDELVVTVSNPRGRGPEADAVPGSGYGLIGMRERVTHAGGTLRTGWTDDDEYRVRAVFPLRVDEVTT